MPTRKSRTSPSEQSTALPPLLIEEIGNCLGRFLAHERKTDLIAPTTKPYGDTQDHSRGTERGAHGPADDR